MVAMYMNTYMYEGQQFHVSETIRYTVRACANYIAINAILLSYRHRAENDEWSRILSRNPCFVQQSEKQKYAISRALSAYA